MLLKDFPIVKEPTRLKLEKKGFITTTNMARLFPRKYLDYRKILPLDEAAGNNCAITGYVQKVEVKLDSKAREIILMEIIESSSGQLVLIKWYSKHQFDFKLSMKNHEIVVCGKVEWNSFYNCYLITAPEYINRKEYFKGSIIPVYRKFGAGRTGIGKDNLKSIIDASVDCEREFIQDTPELTTYGNYEESLQLIHNPKTPEDVENGYSRILMDDLVYLATKLAESNLASNTLKSTYLPNTCEFARQYLKTLPFDLTDDQKAVFTDIYMKMKIGDRVSALIQGDVSCGKTIVAILLMLVMAENGYQSVMMAPTQVLAAQHYNEIAQIGKLFGLKTAFLSSELKAKEKNEIIKMIKSGEYQFIIGTHTAFSEKVIYKNLGLAITDEEHRFGVKQREMLKEKGDKGTHIISMSATPIPRSMAEVLYTGRDIYEIKQMPGNRIPVQTAINNNEKTIFEFALKQLKQGRQIYVICPWIDAEDESDVDSVIATAEKYRKEFIPKGYKVACAIGGSNKKEKEETAEALRQFKMNEVQILVATTVVEVGVNVPNASLIIIHNAERFGLAQLHQLRGRVGRGSYKSYCILKSSDKHNKRLQVLVDTLDGFKIAEEDLKLRGPGNLIGTEQTGYNKLVELMLDNQQEFIKATNIAQNMSIGDKNRLLCKYEGFQND